MAVVTKLDRLVAMAQEKSSERRRALLREITDLFFEAPPEAGTETSSQFDDVLSALAEQAAQEARQELSARFADESRAPRGLILKLATDALEVAAPILSQSQVLTEEDLLNVAEQAGQGHLKAITRREAVPERVSDTIVRRGDDETVASLIRNDGAQISRAAYEQVTRRAEASPTLQGPLAEREDTPIDLLNDLMSVVEKSVRQQIEERFDRVDPQALDAALKASQARLAKRLAEDAEIEAAQKEIGKLVLRRQLTPPALVQMLRDGKRAQFIVGFSELAQVDLTAARQAVDQDSVDPLALICKAAGFDKALFVTLAVLRKGKADEAFNDARALGELYAQITPANAERAIRFWKMRKDVAA